MISRIERAESSPTVFVLNELSIGLGVPLTELFGPGENRQPRLQQRNPVVTRKGQAEWVDPASGYRRRNLTPATTPLAANCSLQLQEVLLPPDARVVFENALYVQQQIWMLRGQIEIRSGNEITTITAGDCMTWTQSDAMTIHNNGGKEARYIIATLRPAR